MNGAVPPPSLFVFMAWAGKTILVFDVINVGCTMPTVVLTSTIFVTSWIRCGCYGLWPWSAWCSLMVHISRFYPGDRIRMFIPRFGSTLLSLCIVMTKQTINWGFLVHVIASDFSRFRPARVLLYLHIPLSDIQRKECWLASLVETGGGGEWPENGV